MTCSEENDWRGGVLVHVCASFWSDLSGSFDVGSSGVMAWNGSRVHAITIS